MVVLNDLTGGIAATNYYASEVNLLQKAHVSYHAGSRTWRVLTPEAASWLPNIMQAWRAVMARGEWMEGLIVQRGETTDALEIVFDDHSNAPMCLFTTMEAVDGMDGLAAENGTLVVYARRMMNDECGMMNAEESGGNGAGMERPREVIRLPATFRRVRDIPCVELD